MDSAHLNTYSDCDSIIYSIRELAVEIAIIKKDINTLKSDIIKISNLIHDMNTYLITALGNL